MIFCFVGIAILIAMAPNGGNEAKAGSNPHSLPRGNIQVTEVNAIPAIDNVAVLIDTVKIWSSDGHLRIDTIYHKGHLYIYFHSSDSSGMTHSVDCMCLGG